MLIGKRKLNTSHLAKHATITGKHNGKDYAAIIDLKSGIMVRYLGLFGDTRFENITFNHVDGSYDILYCQYHNLEMGEGIQMTGYTKNSPGYGTIDGARICFFPDIMVVLIMTEDSVRMRIPLSI